jgi:ubiquinone/menaquinone biosynthesis C-methylase UbiE
MGYVIDPEGHETRVLHELCDFGGKDVLEIGCGDGRLTWRFADVARSVLGLDLNEEWIARAIAATPEHLEQVVHFQVANIVTAQLPEESFDVAILSWSL